MGWRRRSPGPATPSAPRSTAQAALLAEVWPDGVSMSVRMGLHSGEADERENGFFGAAVNRAARIMSVARGGQILLSAVTAGLAAGVPGVELRPVGSRHLRGVSEPVDVVVVLADGVDLNATPPPVDVVEGNLPRPVTEYVGDLAELRRRVGGLSGRRLVTLTGSGGRRQDAHGDRDRLVEQRPVPRRACGWWSWPRSGVGDAVPAAVAATLGVQLQPGSTMTESIVAWLRSRPTLLILDNCEHVLDHVAPLVAAIEAGAPEATVLATSREPLGLPGEVVRRVPSLDPATDAVQLFAERAATASDGFVLDDANRPVVVGHLCPVGRDPAGHRTGGGTGAGVDAGRDPGPAWMTGSGCCAAAAGAATNATRRSWPPSRGACSCSRPRSGACSSGCRCSPAPSRSATPKRCAASTRSTRWRWSICCRRWSTGRWWSPNAGPDGATRYRLLETLRQYGEQALAADSSTATMRDRHLAHFLGRAEHWCAQQCTADEPEANRAFAVNWDNLRAAFDWALATGRGA